jgi:hypothetical protein
MNIVGCIDTVESSVGLLTITMAARCARIIHINEQMQVKMTNTIKERLVLSKIRSAKYYFFNLAIKNEVKSRKLIHIS